MHSLRIAGLGKPNWGNRAYALLLLFATTAIASQATTFTDLASFDGTNGAGPAYMSLVQGTDGNFYGTTPPNPGSDDGTLFVCTPGGTLTTLATGNFGPAGRLIQATDGNFYGLTVDGGDLSKATTTLAFADGATQNAVKLRA